MSTGQPQFWSGIIIRGRGGTYVQWTTKVKISCSLNGIYFEYVDNGRAFTANTDQNTKVRIDFATPAFCRVLRINPVAWHNHPSLRL